MYNLQDKWVHELHDDRIIATEKCTTLHLSVVPNECMTATVRAKLLARVDGPALGYATCGFRGHTGSWPVAVARVRVTKERLREYSETAIPLSLISSRCAVPFYHKARSSKCALHGSRRKIRDGRVVLLSKRF